MENNEYQNKKNDNDANERSKNLQEKEDEIMPTIELAEKERIDYLNDMINYIEDLKKLSPEQLVKKSKKNLMASGIINENGELTEIYNYSNNDKRK